MKIHRKANAAQILGVLQRHPRLAKLGLFCFSALLSLVVAEVVLRVAGIGNLQEGHHQLFCEYHPILGWQKKPDFSGVHIGPREIYRIRETMNSRGIRGPEYPYEKPEKEFRILVLGDSFAEGYTVEFENLFSEVLKRQLNKSHAQPVEVINAGTGGYSTDQELLWFTTEGTKYSSNLVVLLVCPNDILYNTVDRYARGYKPLYRLKDGSLVLTNVPLPLPIAQMQSHSTSVYATQPESLQHQIRKWLYNSSHVYRKTRTALVSNDKIVQLLSKVGISPPTDDSRRGHNAEARDATQTSPEPDYIRFASWKKATDEERRIAWRLTAALLSKIKAEVESVGSRLLVMIVPGNEQVTSGVLSICRQEDIDCVDPTARFIAEKIKLKKRNKQLTFAPLDYHWNTEGHRLAAELLFDHIISSDYIFRNKTIGTDTIAPNRYSD